MDPQQPESGDRPTPSRQSALSAQREPYVPPGNVLDQVSGRVLDPGTALAVKDVRPRSTVYVGPRLLVSRSGETATRVRQLQEVAEGLGWLATVHPDDERDVTDEQDDARLGVVRLDLTVRDERATIAPDGWVLLQNARAAVRAGGHEPGRPRPHRAGPQHRPEPVPRHRNPFHGSNPAGGSGIGRRVLVRGSRARRSAADRLRRSPTSTPSRRAARGPPAGGGNCWTPAAGSTPGWPAW